MLLLINWSLRKTRDASDVEATPARFSAAVAAARTLITRAKAKLGIAPVQLAADKAYGNGPLLGWLIDEGITPHVPVIDRTRQRDDFFTRDAFQYDRDANVYHCPNNKLLTYRGSVPSPASSPEMHVIRSVPSAAPKSPSARDSVESGSSVCSGT